ncbi:hypothetical protein ACH5AO_11015 [Streptomyces sp. NPDC018964]|uniref:hypothetical protein n=1 Tax=Streptomyces sp. NPDC018964 TaxID=3365058 RepID=UPI0037A8C20D
MATILAHGVAEPPTSGYSARPDDPDHKAYRIGHVLYNRSTPVGERAEGDGDPHIGHPPGTGPARERAPRRTAAGAPIGTGITRGPHTMRPRRVEESTATARRPRRE